MSLPASAPAKARLVALLLLMITFHAWAQQMQHPPRRPVAFKLVSERKEFFTWGGFFYQPLWIADALVGLVDSHSERPVIFRIPRNGVREEIPLDVPEARLTTITGLAGAPDGTIVAIGLGYAEDGRRAGFLAKIAPDHRTIALTRLAPYVPRVVAMAPDHSIWTIGFELKDDDPAYCRYDVLKHFDSEGRVFLTKQLKVQSALGGSGATQGSLTQMLASTDRVRWLTDRREYLEISLNGEILFSVPPPSGTALATIAVTAEGEVFAGASTVGPKWAGVFHLERDTKSWIPTTLPAESHASLGGFDGDQLVVVRLDGRVQKYGVDLQ